MARRLLVTCLAALATLAVPAGAQADSAVSDEIVVMRAGGLTPAELDRAGVTPERDLRLDGVEVVRTEDGRRQALAALRADPDVAWAEPNQPRRVSTEPLGGLLWGLSNTGQSVWWALGTPDADVDAPEAWSLTRGAGVTVAVADTGADLGHPDLAGRLADGYDFVGDDAEPQDGHGHGTHVAGVIAAGENGVGVVGIAPEASIMPLRVLDDAGTGNSADVAAAFDYAGDRGVRVVNASLGSPYPSIAERYAIQEHPGTLYVVAAGNGGGDGAGDDVDGGAPEYPCAYDEPNVVCVGATDPHDARAAFSNYGAASVDLFAPGQNIVSTYVRGRATVLNEHFGTGDGYEIMQGTSMATPHVAGAAALTAAVQPAWTGSQVKSVLLDGADRRSGLDGLSVSGGRLNAAAAVRIATGRPPEGDGPAPAPLGPDPGGAQQPQPGAGVPAASPSISRMRLAGRPRVCRRKGCQARTASISFVLDAEADVTVRLQPARRCGRSRCGWRPGRSVTRHEPAGRTRWTIGQRLLGMPLRRGAWRLTLATADGRAERAFRVR